MDQIVVDGGKELAQYGLLGIACVFLLWYIGRLQQELKDLRDAHKEELAAKDKTIADLQEARLVEAKQGWQLASATKTTLDSFYKVLGGNGS
jgi:hypothetical protein